MRQVLHKADTRGFANHGWLKSYHTFSFAGYYNPDRMHFGALRVLNDDVVDGGRGFGDHPHDNMEIISIPLEGDLEHRDSLGNTTLIRKGDVQVMSAGTGLYHSEYNKNKGEPVAFLQIWVFPKQMNVAPRYDQISLEPAARHNRLQQILSPNPHDEGVWIYQDAWFYLARFDEGKHTTYQLKQSGHGVYVFVLKGELLVGDQALQTRDGLGVSETDALTLQALSEVELLLMEVPMSI